MKKLFLFAATAMLFAACTSEDVVAPQTGQLTADDGAVGFDVYVPGATAETRAGQVGTMTTGRLQRTEANGGGFGVYAYLVEDEDDNATATHYFDGWQSISSPTHEPNFMVNEKILWNATNQGWYYSPLKYWPNETDNDSQTTPAWMQDVNESKKHLDRITFFAYAPYVSAGVDEPGVTLLTNKVGYLDTDPTSTSTTTGSLVEASVGYKASLDDPEASVDLLWGVAPAGGMNYTAVNGEAVSVTEGLPLIDMTKPDVNTNMKFLFEHALARIGVYVRAAIDQVPAGGTLDSKTKITIDEVTLTGVFGETGILNLDNPTANVANWVDINGTTITSGTSSLATSKTLTLSADAGTIAPWLRYKGEHTWGSYSEQNVTGVTTANQDLITPRYYALDEIPAYSPTKQYYTNPKASYTVKSTDAYYTLSGQNYEKVSADTKVYDGSDPGYYTLAVSGPYLESGSKPSGAGITNATNCYELNGTTYEYKATVGSISWGSGSQSYYILTPKAVELSDFAFEYDNKATATYTVTATDNIYTYNGVTDVYVKHGSSTIYAPAIGSTATPLFKLEKVANSDVLSTTATCPSEKGSAKYYTYESGVFTYVGKGSDAIWGKTPPAQTYWEVEETALKSTDIAFAYSGTIYDVERNYFMVVPTNNVKTLNTSLLEGSDEEKALRTIRVKIKYYVTTEDDKVNGGRTQIENVIEKDVLFPSLANGKSYNLNLVLGLTSVKIEAEVDDWKVVNVQADLPQNTAGE